jgi:diacylglycerol kinase family enzyme
VVAAGDGTIGDVASELVGGATVLGIVPIGTMNNLARSLGVPLGIDDACALIGMGTTRHIDVGRVISNGSTQAEYFMECAGIGLSAIAALAGQSFEKRRWLVIPRTLRKFIEAKLGTILVEMDDMVIEASTRMVTVSNAPLMGNNMLAAPGAKMDDGLLDVQIYDGMGDAALVRHFMAASSGSPDALKTYRVRRVRLTADEPVLTNSDMNITRQRHVVDIEVFPKALSMIVGNGIALSVPVESAPNAPTFAVSPPHTNGDKPAAELAHAKA